MKDNKLIAEFMGANLYAPNDYEMYGIIDCIADGENEQHFFTTEQMKFQTSWDWLMPVVDACMNYGHMTQTKEQQFIIQSFAFVDITKTYKAVIEFIKWYNKNKS